MRSVLVCLALCAVVARAGAGQQVGPRVGLDAGELARVGWPGWAVANAEAPQIPYHDAGTRGGDPAGGVVAPDSPFSSYSQLSLARAIGGWCANFDLQMRGGGRDWTGSACGSPAPRPLTLHETVMEALPEAHDAYLKRAVPVIWPVRGPHGEGVRVANTGGMAWAPVPQDTRDLDLVHKEQAEWLMIDQLRDASHAAELHAVLRSVATWNDQVGGYALSQLIDQGDAADIPLLHDVFMGRVDGLDHFDLTEEFKVIPRSFGTQGVSLLQSLVHASSARVRAAAVIELAMLGDRVGMAAIVDELRGDRSDNHMALLNGLINTNDCLSFSFICHRGVNPETGPKEPWLLMRKVATIQYFENRLREVR